MHSHAQELSGANRTASLRTISDLADEWQVHRNTIHALVRRGELRAVRVGNRLRFRDEDVGAYLERPEEPKG